MIIDKTIGLSWGINYKAGLKLGIDVRVRSYLGYQNFGHVINRVGKIVNFGHK